MPRPPSRCWTTTKDKLDDYDAKGRIHWPNKPGGMPRLKLCPEDLPGVPMQDIWSDIRSIHNLGRERLGYPTQKPLALLDRIIQASSNEGDIVLDPFCGCGTAITAAHELKRRWVGIDITHLAIALQKYRLEYAFKLTAGVDYQVVGEPQDIGAARQLAEDDRYQFQWWTLSLVRAQPLGGSPGGAKGKKGADRGVDGVITFLDEANRKAKQVLVQVKSGHVGAAVIRDLRGTIEREDAAIGVFITLEPPTSPMIREAVEAGFYESPT